MSTSFAAGRLATGFSWTECPRWHDGLFHFSDMYNGRIVAVDDDGRTQTLLDLSGRQGLEGQPIVTVGTGFLPDGRLLVNSMFERVVLAYDGSATSVYADLRELAIGPINDMVIDAAGRAYVTQLGCNLFAGESPKESPILVVEPDGTARIADEAGPLMGANGIAISADGAALVTAETFADKITAFDIGPHGKLTGKRTFAEMQGDYPDGLCLDEQGAVWTALTAAGRVVRVAEGGEIVAEVSPPAAECGVSTACGLGGADRRTLYICCGFEVMDAEKSRREGQGSIWTARVPVTGGSARP
ncbi:SMP-30/gluconolactonase/LRE family protein [Mycobacterium sp.]|uniref:SMP-30/gluconolactonase/LRE family protein n=1 Tax=Mycobacterium sp. TaxID=1785 RepID=UPI002BFDF2E8|nr:SMP-30/gluconolactonase/LRE family protein [Mycobacterium sp.]HME49546.1 SMP-30/gluconolactonase/LRE family protein [Mycobacterium sp.]